MNWLDDYRSKLESAEEAVGRGPEELLQFRFVHLFDPEILFFQIDLPRFRDLDRLFIRIIQRFLGDTSTAAGRANVITYTGGTVAAGSTCTVQVDVTSGTGGTYVNTTGRLTSSSGDSGTATYTLTVTLCSYVLSPDSASVGPNGSSGSFSVTAASSCPWTASTGTSWITVNTTSGSGNGTVKGRRAAVYGQRILCPRILSVFFLQRQGVRCCNAPKNTALQDLDDFINIPIGNHRPRFLQSIRHSWFSTPDSQFLCHFSCLPLICSMMRGNGYISSHIR